MKQLIIILTTIFFSCSQRKSTVLDYPLEIELKNKMILEDFYNIEEINYHIYNGYYFVNSKDYDFIALQTLDHSTEEKPIKSLYVHCIQIGTHEKSDSIKEKLSKSYAVEKDFYVDGSYISVYKKDFLKVFLVEDIQYNRIFIFLNGKDNMLIDYIKKRKLHRLDF